MGVRVLRSTTIVLILLGFFIFLISSVNAFSVEISGQQGILGVRGLNDITGVKVESSSNVSILRGDNDYPMSCSEDVDGIFHCSHVFEQASMDAGEYVLTFLKLPEAQIYTWPFIVDGKKPAVSNFKVVEYNGKLNITFRVQDQAFVGSEKCSGIRSIEVTSESDVFHTETISSSGLCSYERSIIVTPPRVSGTLTFSIVVTDFMGQYGNASYGPIDVDFMGPEIQEGVIILNGEKELGMISKQPSIVPVADVHIKVDDDNLSTVKGDMSSLSRDPALKSVDSSRPAICTKQGGMYDCKFESVQINPGASEVKIEITATDIKGHISTKNISATFEIQKDLSEVIYFGRDKEEHCFEDVCYYKTGANKLFLHVDGHGVEIKPYLITISGSDLSSLEYVKASKCNDTGSYYECYGYLPVDGTVESGLSKTIVLTTPSTDSLGSKLTGISKTQAIVDTDAPVNNTPLEFSALCPIAGETNYFRINVTDTLSPIVRIKAETQNITTQDYFEKDCQRQGNIFFCELPINSFVSYPENEVVNVEVVDLAGNVLEIPYEVQVSEANRDIPPESISSITSDTGQKLDKRMLTLQGFSTNVYLPLEFDFKGDVEVVDLDTTGCLGTKEINGRPYFLNEQFTTQEDYEPILVVPVGGRETLLDDDVIINCTIKIYEKRGVVRYTKPEEETIIVSVETFGQELGTIDETTQAKLDDIVGEINDLQDSIDTWMSWLGIVDTICSISNTINTVFSTISAVETVVYGVAVSFSWISAVEKMWTNVLCPQVFEKLNQMRSKLNPVGSLLENAGASDNLQIGVDSFLKLGCLTYNCGLCSPEGVLQAVNIVASGVSQAKELNEEKALDSAEDSYELAQKQQEEFDKYQKLKSSGDLDETQKKRLETLEKRYKDKTSKDIKKQLDAATSDYNSLQAGENVEALTDSFDISEEELEKIAKSKGTDLESYSLDKLSVESAKAYKKSLTDQINAEQKAADKLRDSEDYSIWSQEDRKTAREYESKISNLKASQQKFDNYINYNDVEEEKTAFAERQANIETGGFVESVDPYENVNFAKMCLCGPGIVYAKEKLMQLNCRLYKCIEENSANGLPITSCEIDFDQGKCMYYEGPKSNQGFREDFFNKIIANYFWGETGDGGSDSDFATFNQNILTSRKILCADEYLPFDLGGLSDLGTAAGDSAKCSIATGWRSVSCAVTGAYLTAANYESYFETPWESALRDVSGENYCGGIDLSGENEE